jgi:simple sugar transport system permease protein
MIAVQWRSSLEKLCLPIGALGVALLIFGIFCALAGANPFGVYYSIYRAAFGSGSSFQNTLIQASPLMLSSLCTALPARLGLVIIGNEGAIVVGGLAAVVGGLALSDWGAATLVVQVGMAVSGFLIGGIWIGIVGALRHYRGVNETISSLLLNYIAIAVLNHLVNGPLRDPSSLNKPSTHPIPKVHLLETLPGTRVHYGLLLGLVACGLAYFLIQRTTLGFAARAAGGNIRAAKIAGLPVGKLTLTICFLAGACAGLAGMVEVAGVHGRANASLNANYGYSGVLVAFIARHNPLAASLVSLLLGGILASGGLLQRAHELPDATVMVFQGIVFLVVLFSDSLYGRFSLFQNTSIPQKRSPSASGENAV